MDGFHVTVGDVVTNGTSAGVLLNRERNSRWRAEGWRMSNVGLDRFDGNVGMTSFVPDYLMTGWRRIDVGEWNDLPVDVPYRVMQSRYVWRDDRVGGRLRLEYRDRP